MIFTETKLKGAFIIEPEPLEDERGFFARTFCRKEFESYGLNPKVVQCNVSYNKKGGTLRGMHYQDAPYEEAKLVSCISGAIYDVIIDLRLESPTYCQWFAATLYGFNFSTHPPIHPSTHKLLYIPEGFAHGFLTLTDNTEVFYQMSEFYMPEYARGVRWDDVAFSIKWPSDIHIISEKDRNYPDFIQ
jgi:dTDP-4-dehydrorhamnose 3,5-epimerase